MIRKPAVSPDEQTTPEVEVDIREQPKTLQPIRHPITNLWQVRYTGGGELPQELQGSWTNVRMANQAIANYETTKAQLQQQSS